MSQKEGLLEYSRVVVVGLADLVLRVMHLRCLGFHRVPWLHYLLSMRKRSALEIQRVHRRQFEANVFCRRVTFGAYICKIILFVIVSVIFGFMTNYKVVIMMMDCLEKFEKVVLRLLDELEPERAIGLLRLASPIDFGSPIRWLRQ